MIYVSTLNRSTAIVSASCDGFQLAQAMSDELVLPRAY